MTCCLVLSVDLATDFSATFGPSVFGRSAIVIREFASASMWLFLDCMPCRVTQSVRPLFVLLTDSDLRHGNISTDEEHWVDHHKMIGTLAPFFRSFVISGSSVVCDADVDEHMVCSWQSLFVVPTPTSGQRLCCLFLRGCGLPAQAQATARVDVPTSHGLLGHAERLIRTVSCG